jgi:hypothetical protein
LVLDQSLRPLEPTLHDIALRTDADRLLERAAEVIGAETGNPGEIGQRQSVIEMGFDIIAYSLQAIAGLRAELGRRRCRRRGGRRCHRRRVFRQLSAATTLSVLSVRVWVLTASTLSVTSRYARLRRYGRE